MSNKPAPKPVIVGDHTARALRDVARLIADADALLITAGAGMSADSGLPVFRGNDGFWDAYPPLRHLGISFERMAQPHWFAEKPRMAWAFYGHRLQLYREVAPHPGYELLRRWAERMPAGAFVVTTNVDGQFSAAGFTGDGVAEQHGSIHQLQCIVPCSAELWDAPETDLDIDLDTLEARGDLPRCPRCGSVARPNILMFNDGSWVSEATRVQMRRFDAWLAGVRGRRLVVLEIGAGKALPTLRATSERIAQRPRTTLVRTNPDDAVIDESVLVLPLPALQALTQIAGVLPQRFVEREPRNVPASSPPASSPSKQALHTVQARPMETIELPSPLQRARTRRGTPPELAAITWMDLGFGSTSPLDAAWLQEEEIAALLAPWFESGPDRYVPLPACRGFSAAGYRMSGSIVAPGTGLAGDTPGAALLQIRAPDGAPIVSVGIARRPYEGAWLWRRLHEESKSPLQSLDYPVEPWIARRREPAAARHAASLTALGAIEIAIGTAWLRYQARVDRSSTR